MNFQRGEVALVSAGPGDPELLTLKAVKALMMADVVLVDALVHPEILTHCRPGTRIVPVGKRGDGTHQTRQDQIHTIMVFEATQHKRVVRLKGGDVGVFARGGEEVLALHEADIPYHIIPGVSSALAAPVLHSAFPTFRKSARHFSVVTGASADDIHELKEQWAKLAQIGGTLIILMGRKNLKLIQSTLLDEHLAPQTPVLIVQHASMENERTLTTTLTSMFDDVVKYGFGAPMILIIGDVLEETKALRAESQNKGLRPRSASKPRITFH